MINLSEFEEKSTDIHIPRQKPDRSSSVSPKKPLKRPATPHIDLQEIGDIRKLEPDQVKRNFSVLMKQIVDNNNQNFLNGDINLIEYLISKYTNLKIEAVKHVEKFSIKINSDFGLLNQFGLYLPSLKELKLNFSVVPCINDIGSSFSKLKILHVSDCSLKDLSGTY